MTMLRSTMHYLVWDDATRIATRIAKELGNWAHLQRCRLLCFNYLNAPFVVYLCCGKHSAIPAPGQDLITRSPALIL